jgi:predicted kinase
MATLHLISGLPCSGKTTYATGLRADLGAALFSLDRWLIIAFGRLG